MMTPDDVQRLHDASLCILDEVGVRLEHDAIVELLRRHGARPGLRAGDVRIPPELVREALAQAPTQVELAARDGSTTVVTPESPSIYWTNPAMYLWDGTTRREVTQADLAMVARLSDRLENVQGVMGMAMCDVPPPCRDFVGLRVIAEQTRKHVRVLCFSPTGMEALQAMRVVFPGPWFSVGFTAHGPLRWTHLALEIFRRSAGSGIPATINGEPMAGVTGPVTLAGAIAVGNAEILSGIVINQLLEPGRPVIYNLGLAHVFDMRHATPVTGGPENALFARASAALGRFYRLPSSSWVSTEALYEDEQAALEKMFGLQTHADAGVGVIWGMGQLESEMTLSPAQLVIDDEMIDYARHYRRGITVSDDTLQLDTIREVGIAGSFLETEHTLAHYRDALYAPRLLNRAPRELAAGPLPKVARARVDALLAEERPAALTADEAAVLLQIEHKYRMLGY